MPAPVVRRRLARLDVDAAAFHYLERGGADLAEQFVTEVETAIARIAEYPGGGSPLWGERLDVAGLRTRAVGRFPYLIFYFERAGHAEVTRVLHAQSDIPAWLAAAD
jgi:toxin ParE1/3/4